MASSVQRSLVVRPLSKVSRRSQSSGSVRSLSAIAKDLPPESPDYVDVPRPPQPQIVRKPIVKGVLPTPRRLFKEHGAGPWRTTKTYLESTLPVAKQARPIPTGKNKDYVEYKNRLSEKRRESLEEGLRQLQSRHNRTVKEIAKKAQAKQKTNYENIVRPERDDDRLTSTTILPTVENLISAPLTQEQIAEKRARWEAKEAAKAEERRNNLHTLYMNARDFIVTEDQLNAKINQVFDDPFFQNENDPSIWGKDGLPERLQDIISKQSGSSLSSRENFTMITRQRLQAIAEELTGGKMEGEERMNERAGIKGP